MDRFGMFNLSGKIEKCIILCVDDEQIVLDSIMIQLRRHFRDMFEIEAATDPKDALEAVKYYLEDGYDVPLIISDYIMPDMKGDEFFEEVNQISPHTYKVLLTGQATLEGITNALNSANLFRCLPKPWDERELRYTVITSLERFYQEKHIYELSLKNEQLLKKTRQMFISSIAALAGAIDARDSYTIGHSRRVTLFALQIAQAIGFDDERQEKLEYMSTLHDIGKIGIPDSILNKEGPLTEAEANVMKNHVSIGANILKNIIDFEDIYMGVLYHHERYDGKGYIFGLKGEEIPLEARIIALADAYDAMTSNRPYRSRFSHQEAIAEIKYCAGSQFDPRLAEVFIGLYKERREISTF